MYINQGGDGNEDGDKYFLRKPQFLTRLVLIELIILNVEYGIENEKDYVSSWYSLRLTLTSKVRFTDIEITY